MGKLLIQTPRSMEGRWRWGSREISSLPQRHRQQAVLRLWTLPLLEWARACWLNFGCHKISPFNCPVAGWPGVQEFRSQVSGGRRPAVIQSPWCFQWVPHPGSHLSVSVMRGCARYLELESQTHLGDGLLSHFTYLFRLTESRT